MEAEDLVRLDGCADRLRDRVHVSWPTPPLERETAERQRRQEAAEQREGDPERGRLWLELRRGERDHEADDRRREPDREQGAGEHRHPDAAVKHGLADTLVETPVVSTQE